MEIIADKFLLVRTIKTNRVCIYRKFYLLDELRHTAMQSMTGKISQMAPVTIGTIPEVLTECIF